MWLLAFLFFFLFVIAPQPVFAAGEFDVFYNTTYTLSSNGDAQVYHQITLKNNFSTIYAASYGLVLEGKKPLDITAGDTNTVYQTSYEEQGSQVKIMVNFPDAVVGKDNARTFFVKYKIPGLATRNGQVWDLSIPRIGSPSEINQYNLTLQIPLSFGKTAYISPQPRSQAQTDDFRIFHFAKEDIADTGIAAAFGDFQVFKLNIQYHLENPYEKITETEIALVPDTAYQRVYYDAIDPKPRSIRLDEDGNWLATYQLLPKQKLDINVLLVVQVYATAQDFYPKVSPNDKPYLLAPTKYWQSDDESIIKTASRLKDARAIYDFVVSTLSYDYSRVQEKIERLGASQALAKPNNAICMEFTDLFIALSRSKGIPAREINGYAYSENPRIQPLSLVSDVLHAWPEYWDSNLGVWRPVDPTWGNTTKGINFFDNFDLSHITFVIHGRDSEFPLPAGSYKLASNPQRDVQVEFGTLPKNRLSTLNFETLHPKIAIPLVPLTLKIIVSNSGPTAFYNIPVIINGNKQDIAFIAPDDKYELKVSFKLPFFDFKNQTKMEVQIQDTKIFYTPDNLQLNMIRVLIIFFTLVCLLISSILVSRFLTKKT